MDFRHCSSVPEGVEMNDGAMLKSAAIGKLLDIQELCLREITQGDMRYGESLAEDILDVIKADR